MPSLSTNTTQVKFFVWKMSSRLPPLESWNSFSWKKEIEDLQEVQKINKKSWILFSPTGKKLKWAALVGTLWTQGCFTLRTTTVHFKFGTLIRWALWNLVKPFLVPSSNTIARCLMLSIIWCPVSNLGRFPLDGLCVRKVRCFQRLFRTSCVAQFWQCWEIINLIIITLVWVLLGGEPRVPDCRTFVLWVRWDCVCENRWGF